MFSLVFTSVSSVEFKSVAVHLWFEFFPILCFALILVASLHSIFNCFQLSAFTFRSILFRYFQFRAVQSGPIEYSAAQCIESMRLFISMRDTSHCITLRVYLMKTKTKNQVDGGPVDFSVKTSPLYFTVRFGGSAVDNNTTYQHHHQRQH